MGHNSYWNNDTNGYGKLVWNGYENEWCFTAGNGYRDCCICANAIGLIAFYTLLYNRHLWNKIKPCFGMCFDDFRWDNCLCRNRSRSHICTWNSRCCDNVFFTSKWSPSIYIFLLQMDMLRMEKHGTSRKCIYKSILKIWSWRKYSWHEQQSNINNDSVLRWTTITTSGCNHLKSTSLGKYRFKR